MRKGRSHASGSVEGVTRRRTVIVLEDESQQRAILIQHLKADGFEVIRASAGDEALLLAVENAPDIILLDWSMPVMSGLEVCRHLKTHPILRRIPIILIANCGGGPGRENIVDTGAEDTITQPYSVVELMARLRLQLRDIGPVTESKTQEFEDIVFDGERYQVYKGGTPVRLGPTEFRLLGAMIECPGKVWTREQLLVRVWGSEVFVGTRTVDVHIGRLRRALGQQGADHPLRTVRGIGYAFG